MLRRSGGGVVDLTHTLLTINCRTRRRKETTWGGGVVEWSSFCIGEDDDEHNRTGTFLCEWMDGNYKFFRKVVTREHNILAAVVCRGRAVHVLPN